MEGKGLTIMMDNIESKWTEGEVLDNKDDMVDKILAVDREGALAPGRVDGERWWPLHENLFLRNEEIVGKSQHQQPHPPIDRSPQPQGNVGQAS